MHVPIQGDFSRGGGGRWSGRGKPGSSGERWRYTSCFYGLAGGVQKHHTQISGASLKVGHSPLHQTQDKAYTRKSAQWHFGQESCILPNVTFPRAMIQQDISERRK